LEVLADPRLGEHSHLVLAEAFVDGQATPEQMNTARENTYGIGELSPYSAAFNAQQATIEASSVEAALDASRHAAMGFSMLAQHEAGRSAQEQRTAGVNGKLAGQQAQANILRDIFGDPFCPVTCDPEWRTSTVLALAQGIYDERAFDRMPILADALQDAGCDNAEILDHCRGPGPHVRGCWVVDLLLGKS
jgi:hypothetical protein